MRTYFATAATIAALLLAGCSQPAPAPATPPAETQTADQEGGTLPCAATSTSDWAASVDNMPGVNPVRTLHVHGKAMAPSLGYTWTLTRNAADDPTSPSVRLTLTGTPPAAGGQQVPTTPDDVSYAAPAGTVHFTEVTVLCGRGVVATITDIPETQ